MPLSHVLQLTAEERGVTVDTGGFEAAMVAQKYEWSFLSFTLQSTLLQVSSADATMEFLICIGY
jgi:hypothetical protein